MRPMDPTPGDIELTEVLCRITTSIFDAVRLLSALPQLCASL